MIKRAMMSALLGLALASHTVLAQDMTSPAIPGPDRNVQQPPSGEQKQSEQTRLNQYGTTHDDNAPGYPFNP